jgi:hypothetical protein
MTAHRLSRLRERTVNACDRWYFNNVGNPRQRALGNLTATKLSLSQTSGYEAKILSREYAIAQGLPLREGKGKGDFAFADGSTESAIGRVDALWSFADTPGTSKRPTFGIMQNCEYDAVLSHGIIFDEDLYGSHATRLIEIDNQAETYEISQIGWKESWSFARRC